VVRKTRPKMNQPFKCYIYRSVQGGVIEVVQMADRLADYEDMDSKRICPGDTVWLSRMFYTRPKKPVPVTVDAIRIDREGVMFITGRRRFSEEAIGKTVFLSKEEAERALQGMKGATEK
jgi:hypothetical protein